MYKFYCIVVILFFISCNSFRRIPELNNQKIKLLYSNDQVNKVSKYLKKKKIEEIFYVNAGLRIDPDRDGRVNEKEFADYLKEVAHLNENKSYAVIDWEILFTNLNLNSTSTAVFENTLFQLERCIQIAKFIMPNKKWGFYNLPYANYWQRDENWKRSGLSLKRLLSKVDVLYPSLYDFYRDDNPHAGKIMDEKYINESLDFVFDLNKEINKEIFVFVWHRWHGSNSEMPLKQIDAQEFSNHIATIANFRKDSKRINGIVWWGADRYFYNVKDESIMKEQEGFTSFDQYFNQVFIKYMTILTNEINQSSNN